MDITKSYLCIKEFKMADGSIAFRKDQKYFAIGHDFKSESKSGYDHYLSIETINTYFEAVEPENERLTEIFQFATGGHLREWTYSDRKIAKGVKMGMEVLVEKFFKNESEQAISKSIALEITKKFNIDEAVLEHLKNLTK